MLIEFETRLRLAIMKCKKINNNVQKIMFKK